MALSDQENTLSELYDPHPANQVRTCLKCKQTYLFTDKCPICDQELSEASERLMLASRIKNMIDHMGMVDLFECSVKELRELDIIVTTLFKQKESRNG